MSGILQFQEEFDGFRKISLKINYYGEIHTQAHTYI